MNNSSLVANLDLQIADTGDLVVTMDLLNHLDRDITDWSLRFDLPKEISAGKQTRILSRAGSHLCLQANDNALWPTGEHRHIQFTGNPAIIRRLTDLPMGLFVQSRGDYLPTVLGEHNLAQLECAEALPDYGDTPLGYTGVAPTLNVEPPSSTDVETGPIIPMPLLRRDHPGEFRCSGVLPYQPLPAADDAMAWLGTALPQDLALAAVSDDSARLRLVQDDSLAAEAYRLKVSQTEVTICASTSAGFFYGSSHWFN